MKKYISILFVGLFGLINAQEPTGYYSTATGLTGYALKSKLAQIVTAGAKDMGYGSGTGGLWLGYKTTDIDKYYENDGTVIDMYSENPTANTPGVSNDPYEFKWGQVSAGGKSVWKLFRRRQLLQQGTFFAKNVFWRYRCGSDVP